MWGLWAESEWQGPGHGRVRNVPRVQESRVCTEGRSKICPLWSQGEGKTRNATFLWGGGGDEHVCRNALRVLWGWEAGGGEAPGHAGQEEKPCCCPDGGGERTSRRGSCRRDSEAVVRAPGGDVCTPEQRQRHFSWRVCPGATSPPGPPDPCEPARHRADCLERRVEVALAERQVTGAGAGARGRCIQPGACTAFPSRG